MFFLIKNKISLKIGVPTTDYIFKWVYVMLALMTGSLIIYEKYSPAKNDYRQKRKNKYVKIKLQKKKFPQSFHFLNFFKSKLQ